MRTDLDCGTAGNREVASFVLPFQTARIDVKFDKVDAFPGALLAKVPGPRKLPVVLVLGGAEGGAHAARELGPKLAVQGFAVLGVPYYSPAQSPGGPRELPELPADFTEIPLERLNAVHAWIKSRSDLDADRVALHGASKGAEFALLAAVNFPWIKAVVAMTPTDVVWEGWGFGVMPGTRSSFSLNGTPLPFVPYQDFEAEFVSCYGGSDLVLRRPHDLGRAAHLGDARKARIPVERFKGPMLLIAGHDDQLWASGMMAQNILEQRSAAQLPTEALIFPQAGHYLNGDGWSPTTHYNAGQNKSGGTPKANAHALAQA